MTIRITKPFKGYYEDQIVSGLGTTEENRLIGIGFATADLDGPDNSPESFPNVRAVTDPSTGQTVLVVADGVPIPIGALVDAGTPTSVVTLAAGEHSSVALASGYYKIDPDMDVNIKGSDASSLFGAQLVYDTGAYATAAASLASQTGLNFAANSFSMEFWFNLASNTPNNARLLGFGFSGGTQLDVYAGHSSLPTKIAPGVAMNDSTGAAIKSGANFDSGLPLGSTMYHMVVTVSRTTAGGNATLTYYLNGSVVGTQTFVEAGTPAEFNLNDNTSASARLVIGGTVGNNAEFDGRVEDIKFYKTLLSLSQIQARTNAGPLRTIGTDAADASLSWWMSFQGGVATCVSGYGNATMTATGGATITEKTGGAAATGSDVKIYARKPELIKLSNAYLGLFSDSLSSGSVRLTKVA